MYVSSEENGNPAEKINDGITKDSFRWCAATANDYPSAIIIDLENAHTLIKICAVTHKPGEMAYRFTVSISDELDGEHTVIVDFGDNTDTTGRFTDIFFRRFRGKSVSMIKL